MTLPRSPISLVANSIIATKDAEQFGFDPRQLIFSVGEVLPETQAFVHFQPSTQTIWARKNGDLLHQKLTPSVTIPQFVWCSKDHGEWQVQWPRKKWGQALVAPTPVATHVVQLYQTSWSSDHCWYHGPIARYDSNGRLTDCWDDGGPGCLVMSLCESPSRTSPSPATTPRLFALWDRAYFDLYAMLPYQSVSVSGEHLALTTGLYFLKRQLPNLRFVQLPDSCQGTDGWDRYLENLGLQWARHRATEGEIVLCYPGDWTLTHNEQLRQEINDLSPVIPEKL